ncbi:MAG: ERF family protein [Patescibacteria group bacterium]|nr:ERF family protein [Patescibacteria group bacterium]
MTTEIGKLALALSKAQGEIQGAKKDSTNPHFKSKYAGLASIWEACRQALSKNELAVIQSPEIIDGVMVMRTIIAHSSGEQIVGTLPISCAQNATAQQVGSAITYARRYSLASMVGVAPDEDDDDGNAASETRPAYAPRSSKTEADELTEKAKAFAAEIDLCDNNEKLEAVIKRHAAFTSKLANTLPKWHTAIIDKIEKQRAMNEGEQ